MRRASVADLAAVADLDWRALHEPFICGPRTEERRRALAAVWPDFLEGPDQRLYVAELRGALCGFGAVRIVVGEAELDAIAVEPSERRSGIGRGLLEAIVSELRREGIARIGLEVRAGNAPARRLYVRLGFEEEGVRRGYYDSGDDAVLYGLTLA